MTPLYSLLAFCLLPSLIPAPPALPSANSDRHVSVPFTKVMRTRTERLKSRQDSTVSASVQNNVYDYLIDVSIGSPPQSFRLSLDTGSSDIFVFSTSCSGCSSKYFDSSGSSTFKAQPDLGNFGISYADGSSVGGSYGSDTVGVGNGAVSQTIGIAAESKGSGFENGIFGIGLDRGESIVTNKNQAPYPGYITSLKDSGLIASRMYSIYLDSKTADDGATGIILFGGTDKAKFTGDLVFFPMIEKAPDGQYRLDVAEPTLSYGLGSGMVQVAGVSDQYTVRMDTGTSISYIPEAQFNAVSQAAGAQILGSGPTHSVDCSLAQQADGVNFDFAGPNGKVTVSVPWAEMAVPSDGTAPNGRCLFGLAPTSNDDVSGVYVLGDTFIRSAYLTFDYDNFNIGIAQAKYDH